MFIPSFISYQTIGLPNIISLRDTSTGTDAGIVERRIFLQLYDGTYLTPSGSTTDYILWELGTNTIDLDILDADCAPNISVYWTDGGGFILINDSDSLLINSTDKLIF